MTGREKSRMRVRCPQSEPTERDELTPLPLVRAARNGDSTALNALLARLQPAVLDFCRRRLRDPDRAEDAVQEVLLRVARGLAGQRHAETFGGWVFTIARNFCVSDLRKRRSRDEVLLEDADAHASPATTLMEPDEAGPLDVVAQFASGLPRVARAVVLFKCFELLTHAQIAAVLDCKRATVRSVWQKVAPGLRERLEPGRP